MDALIDTPRPLLTKRTRLRTRTPHEVTRCRRCGGQIISRHRERHPLCRGCRRIFGLIPQRGC